LVGVKLYRKAGFEEREVVKLKEQDLDAEEKGEGDGVGWTVLVWWPESMRTGRKGSIDQDVKERAQEKCLTAD
jgi:hypothetical protein